uniref:Protoheme IX farnesyltransferase, mitochondrial n=1 Tax=Tanacetum cinerariifolium TaxID=118510 RepID=A0A699HFV6_TANCI|nr:protoheme IX farnesyltransferase, mitochondrial [Tanacetum cinerariifolium]
MGIFMARFLKAGVGASTLFLYAFVYTPLKQIHLVNTWVEVFVGAIPPLLGNFILIYYSASSVYLSSGIQDGSHENTDGDTPQAKSATNAGFALCG